jgi:hypothetical protein
LAVTETMQDREKKASVRRTPWDKPILGSQPLEAWKPEQSQRPKRHQIGWLIASGLIGVVIGAVATLGAVTHFPLLPLRMGPASVTPATSAPSTTMAATMPAPRPGDQFAAFEAFSRLAISPVTAEAVEGAFRSYIAVSGEALKAHNDRLEPQVASLGPGLSGAVERRYLEPLLQAGVHLDDCAAAVLAIRLDATATPQEAAEIAAIKLKTCATTGSLAAIAHDDIGAFITTCQARLAQVIAGQKAGRFNAPAFIETAVDVTRIETNPCPDPGRYIETGTP